MPGINILDFYILKRFFGTLFFSLIALSVIFVIVDLLENLDNFLDLNADTMTIVKYYIYYIPEILKIIIPIGTLLSTLFTIGNLSVTNEITAMKSGGMSLYRVMIPMVLTGFLLSFGQLYFNGWVVPKANEQKLVLERKYLKKSEGRSIVNLYFRVSPVENLLMRYYNSDNKTGNTITLERFSGGSNPRFESKTDADIIKWNEELRKWVLINGITRNYGTSVNTITFDTLETDINITHEQIVSLQRSTDEMNLSEIREYISLIKQGGKDVRMQMIEYHGEYAFPFSNLIVILFGVPFASVRKKGGIAIQIAAAMVISFMYLLFMKLSQTIGYSAEIEPLLSGWMANIFFFIAAVVIIIRTRT